MSKLRSKVESHVKKALKKEPATDAVYKIIDGKFFPCVLCEADLGRLPPVLRKICCINAVYIKSGTSGLIGLFHDLSTNTKVDEIARHLGDVGAVSLVALLGELKGLLSLKRFPNTDDQAFAVGDKLMSAQQSQGTVEQALQKIMADYNTGTDNLMEDLRAFLKREKDQLVDELMAVNEGDGWRSAVLGKKKKR